ncbi:type II toxin-antitoxin system MqsA family antitoxin [Luteimonas sp. WGS1318]|uniref:type II toxin-antitoxin system MqsA family antitoxin n=1 Tax=Luteimonas sp. WGS1318 TaxID=3366815 RepID=UPI00372D87E7
MPNKCPFCEKGTLRASSREELRYSGGKQILVAGIEYSLCDVCGEESVGSKQARANMRAVADATLSSTGKWTTAQIAEFRDRHGLTQEQAADLLGGGANAFSKYERGEVLPTKAMDLLMRLYDSFAEVRAYVGRGAAPVASVREAWSSAGAGVVSSADSNVFKIGRMKLRPSSLVVANDADWHYEPHSELKYATR